MKEQLAASGISPEYIPLDEVLGKIVKRTEKAENTFEKHDNTDEEEQVRKVAV